MDVDPPTARSEQMRLTAAKGAKGLEGRGSLLPKEHRVLSTLGLVPFIDGPILWGDMLEHMNYKSD